MNPINHPLCFPLRESPGSSLIPSLSQQVLQVAIATYCNTSQLGSFIFSPLRAPGPTARVAGGGGGPGDNRRPKAHEHVAHGHRVEALRLQGREVIRRHHAEVNVGCTGDVVSVQWRFRMRLEKKKMNNIFVQ